MVKFEDWFFNELHTEYDKASDINKDAQGKGTLERFCNAVGNTIDQLVPYIQNLQKNVMIPRTMTQQMIPYGESEKGYLKSWSWFFNTDSAFRGHLLAIMGKLLQIRGTIPAHEIMFGWIGATIAITEDFSYVMGFDSSLRFDSDIRRFDSKSKTCTGYGIDLNGPVVDFIGGYNHNYNNNYSHYYSNDDFLDAIYTILLFNQPINADITSIIYNGDDIKYLFDFPKYTKLNIKF